MMARGVWWNSAYMKLLVFELLCQFGQNIVNPIVSNYAVAMGATLAVAGFLAGLNSLCSMFLRPVGGLVLKRAPKKLLLVVAAVVFMISSFICAALSSTVLLGVSRVIFGAAFVVKSSLVLALASTAVPREYVGRGVGLVGLTTIVASALGPGIGAWVGAEYGYSASFVVSTALFALAIVVALRLDQAREAESSDDGSRAQGPSEARGFSGFVGRFFHVKSFPVAGLVALLGLIFGAITTLVLLIGEQRGIEGTSLFFLVYAVVTMAVRPFSSKVFDTHGLGKLFYPTAACTCISALLLAFAGSTVEILLAAVFLALGQGCLYPALQAESVCRVSPGESSLAANTFLLGADAGMSLGPIVCGLLFQWFGSTVMMLCLATVGVILMGAFPFYSRYAKKAFSPSHNDLP